MTITATATVFPNNVVNFLDTQFQTIDADLFVVKRPLRNSDPNQSVGIFGQQWLPDEQSHEMLGNGFHNPSLERYSMYVQAFVKDMDEERGLAVHSVLSEHVRSMLYRNDSVRVGLSSLSTNLNGVQKRTRRWGVRNQRYVSNEISGSWLYLSILEFWIEVETI